jgi:putative FmdB family regulatory protein
MPTYDFVCPARHEFERFFRKISDAPSEMPCPECGSIAVRKVSGGAALLFKGSGFYITDYGKDGKKPQGAPVKKETSTAPESSSGSTSSDASASGKGEGAKGGDKSSGSTGSKPSSGSSGSE